MIRSAGNSGRPLVVGTNYRKSSLGLRDRLFIEDAVVPPFLQKLRELGIGQAMVLSTCDRVEVLAVHENVVTANQIILERLADHGGLTTEELRSETYTFADETAVDHVFRVAASLDSLVVGEPHVLGQTKAAYRLARDARMVGSELGALMQAAFAVAKRVFLETAVGKGPVSIASVAVQVAEDLLGNLQGRQAVLVGSGEMGQLVGKNLLGAGLGRFVVTHPILERAQLIAQTMDSDYAPFEGLAEQLVQADIILTALGRRNPFLVADMVHVALRKRRWKPVFLVDLAVPGDIEPAINRIDDAFLYTIEDLERLASESQSKRKAEAKAGRRIVADEVVAYSQSRRELDAVPILTEFRDWGEKLREQALNVAGDDAERATRFLLRRLMHNPTEALKAAAQNDATEFSDLEITLRRVFKIDKDDTKESDQT